MPSPSWKTKYVQLSLTTEALHRLKSIAMEHEDKIPHGGTLTHVVVAHWMVHSLLGPGKVNLKRVLTTGRRVKDEMEARAEGAATSERKKSIADGPENPDDEESGSAAKSTSPRKTTTRVWTRSRKKPGNGDREGLNSDRPAGRKMSDTPGRK